MNVGEYYIQKRILRFAPAQKLNRTQFAVARTSFALYILIVGTSIVSSFRPEKSKPKI